MLPHQTSGPFALADGQSVTLPQIAVPERDHYREFVDAVLGGGKEKCSADFDYAGPLTESVLIGNVAVHFPGEALAFDAKALTLPDARGKRTRT